MKPESTVLPEPKTPAEALGRDLRVAATEAYNLFLASHRDVAGKDLPDEERTRLDELARLMAEAIKKVMGTAPREVLEECFARVWTRHAIDEIQTRIDQKAILDVFRQSMAEIVDKHAERGQTFPHPFQKADRKDGKTKNETEKKKYAKPSKGRKRKSVA